MENVILHRTCTSVQSLNVSLNSNCDHPHLGGNPREFDLFEKFWSPLCGWKTVNLYVITCFCAIFNLYFYANSTFVVSKYCEITHLLKSIQENWLHNDSFLNITYKIFLHATADQFLVEGQMPVGGQWFASNARLSGDQLESNAGGSRGGMIAVGIDWYITGKLI